MTTPKEGEEGWVRAALRDESAHVEAPEDLFERVRGAAVVRGRVRAATILAAGAVLLAGGSALAVTWSKSSTTVQTVHGDGAPLSCPSAMPDPTRLPTGQTDAGKVLVPGQPKSGIACVFKFDTPAGSSSTQETLVRSAPLNGSALAAVVNSLQKPVSHYTFRCMAAAKYADIYLEFAYTDGPDVAVEVSVHCPNLTNGTVSGAFNSAGTLPPAIGNLLAGVA